MYKTKILICSTISLLLLFPILSGCQIASTANSQINQKSDITRLMKEKNHQEIQQFITDNLDNPDKKSLLSSAFAALYQSNDKQDQSFLKSTCKELIKQRDIDSLKNMLTPLGLQDIETQITQYQKDEKQYTELKKQQDSLNNSIKGLEKKYPYKNISWSYTKLDDFTGNILQKISNNEYRVHEDFTFDNKEYVLKTIDTTFTTTGHFGMYVVAGDIESYKLQNGFTQSFQTIDEVPNDYVNLIMQINQNKVNLNQLTQQMKNISLTGDISGLNNSIDDIFNYEQASKAVKQNNNPNVYENKQYGFTITFPDQWIGHYYVKDIVVGSDHHLYFYFKTKSKVYSDKIMLFIISNKSKNKVIDETQGTPDGGTYLGTHNGLSFLCTDGGGDPSEEILNNTTDLNEVASLKQTIPEVIKSFRFE
jgi:hypothetical protein